MRSLLPRAAIASMALLLMASGALAQGVVDQQNDPAGGSGFGCGSPPILNGSVQQSFVPSADNLVAVELRLMAGSAFPTAGASTTARIRDGSSSGTVLGEATASVAGPLSANTQMLVRFDFSAVTLTPGNTYLIEWVTPPTTVLMWVGQGGDPYASGTAYSCSGNAWPVSGTDFNFVTYKAEPPPIESTESEGPTGCDAFEQLAAAVGGLGSAEFRRCSLERLVANAAKHYAKGKLKATAANVTAIECQARVLSKLGVIDDVQLQAVLDAAQAVRDCIGIQRKGKSQHGWSMRKHGRRD